MLLLGRTTMCWLGRRDAVVVEGAGGVTRGHVRGAVDVLAVLVRRLGPAQVVAFWDADRRPWWRTDLVPSSWAHRARADGGEDAPDGLAAQVEAIATLATRGAATGLPVDVVSGDGTCCSSWTTPSMAEQP